MNGVLYIALLSPRGPSCTFLHNYVNLRDTIAMLLHENYRRISITQPAN